MIELKSLTKKYKGFTAVDNIDLTINRGEIFGLLGPNGAGKSTTISMIATLLKPTAGQILYRGTDIVKQPKAIQPHIGLVPQEIALFTSLSGLDNLKFWGSAYGLKGDVLNKRIEHVSNIIGIDKRLKDKVDGYSGGMKRRLNIGAALLHEPELLIMDEPTVGIDPQSRNYILESVQQLNKVGVTVIYTSHYMEEIEALCSRIAIMDNGKVIAAGTKTQLMAQLDESSSIVATFDRVDKRLIDQLAQHPAIDDVVVDENKISLNGRQSIVIRDIFELANQFNCQMQDVSVAQPNLETLFLKLTGKSLRD